MRTFTYLPMRRVHHGSGALDRLTDEVAATGARRVLVVTSPSVREQPLVADVVERMLSGWVVAVYDGVVPHAPYECLQGGLDLLHANGAEAIVAIGAGSVMDAARALALAAGEGLVDARELERWRAVVRPEGVSIPATSGRAIPVLAVPSTLSAAEFANSAAITSQERGTKDLLLADEITPRAVLLDPGLAATTPTAIWSSTGMRALDHAIETVYSPRAGPIADALALDAIRRLPTALRAAQGDPSDLAARAEGQVAAWESYFGEMDLTLGLSHAIGHQVGARYGVQHGWTSCALLPTVMRWLAPTTAPQQARIAEALGVRRLGASDEAAAADAASAVEALVADLGLPGSLGALGVEPESYARLAEQVMADPVVLGSPRPVTADDVYEILRLAAS